MVWAHGGVGWWLHWWSRMGAPLGWSSAGCHWGVVSRMVLHWGESDGFTWWSRMGCTGE